MTANQAMFPIQTMCKSFGVSRAGYYAWLGRAASARSKADTALTARIKAIHKASSETYGAPRIHAELIDEGVRVGRKRVERLMKAAGIAGVSRRKAARTTVRDERLRPASIWSTATSMPRSPTSSGWPTSPTCRPGPASSIWPSCWMPSHAASSAGRWATI